MSHPFEFGIEQKTTQTDDDDDDDQTANTLRFGGEVISFLYCNTFSTNISSKTDVECDLSLLVACELNSIFVIKIQVNFQLRIEHIL